MADYIFKIGMAQAPKLPESGIAQAIAPLKSKALGLLPAIAERMMLLTNHSLN
ncbi:MAG: hypothetical protein PHY54_04280 [Methylococcales bacterium]|nr:hypothetical protein [Methylococcales bacterium]